MRPQSPYVECGQQFSKPNATVIYAETTVRIPGSTEEMDGVTVGLGEITIFGKDTICISQI